jgi:hypothetical protein
MSRIDRILIGLILLGILFFIYGTNYYNEIAGWAGVFLFVSGIAVLIFFYLYNWLTKGKDQKL